MGVVEDLRDRIKRAADHCEKLAEVWPGDATRLNGKADGLRVALAYVDEALRISA